MTEWKRADTFLLSRLISRWQQRCPEFDWLCSNPIESNNTQLSQTTWINTVPSDEDGSVFVFSVRALCHKSSVVDNYCTSDANHHTLWLAWVLCLLFNIAKVTEHKPEANFHLMCNLWTLNMEAWQQDEWSTETLKILNSTTQYYSHWIINSHNSQKSYNFHNGTSLKRCTLIFP